MIAKPIGCFFGLIVGIIGFLIICLFVIGIAVNNYLPSFLEKSIYNSTKMEVVSKKHLINVFSGYANFETISVLLPKDEQTGSKMPFCIIDNVKLELSVKNLIKKELVIDNLQININTLFLPDDENINPYYIEKFISDFIYDKIKSKLSSFDFYILPIKNLKISVKTIYKSDGTKIDLNYNISLQNPSSTKDILNILINDFDKDSTKTLYKLLKFYNND